MSGAKVPNKVQPWQLQQRQSLSLAAKVELAERRIREWYEGHDGLVYVSVSGGLDSTVLADIVWRLYPNVPGVFVNTGLEYPENVEQVRTYGGRVEWLRPAVSFVKVLQTYGFPVVSKRVAHYVEEVRRAKGETATKRLRLTGFNSAGVFSKMAMIPKKWQFLCRAPFKVSGKCCDVMKKRPVKAYNRRTGRVGFLGTRAGEGQQRTQTYYRYGCNAYDLKMPRSTPLAFWLDRDVKQYLQDCDLPHSRLYDPPCNAARSGCVFCMFGVHLEARPNRFERMQQTHPKLYDYCMNTLGLRPVLKALGAPFDDGLFQGVNSEAAR